jgi:outer membrane lipoprotein-sorting protein
MDFQQPPAYLQFCLSVGLETRRPMINRFTSAAFIASLLVSVGAAASLTPAFAQGAPLSLTPQARPATPGAPPSANGATPAPAAAETPQQLIQRINQSLNAATSLVGDFQQISADGRRRSGRLYVMRPGKLRFDYNPPSQLEVISDGSNVAVIDKRVPQQDLYGINQTPLKFLVAERIDVARDTKVLGVRRDKDEVILDIEDRNTVAGTSKIRIHFNGDTFMLRRWTVTDPQGVPTTVQLANLSTQQRPDRSLFVINYQFNASRPASSSSN